MAMSPMAAVLDRKPGWPTGSGVLRWTSTRLLRQHTNQRAEPSRARPSSDLSASASAPLLPAIPQGAASGPTLPNGEAVIMPPKTRGPSGKQVLTRIELQEIKKRVTAMLSEFEATEAAEAVEALSGSTDDLNPGEKVQADEQLHEGAHFEVTRTLIAATKRRLGSVLDKVRSPSP